MRRRKQQEHDALSAECVGSTPSCQALHLSLLAGDSHIAELEFTHLARRVQASAKRLVPSAPAEVVEMAVVDAIWDYYQAPSRYQPSRAGLITYLTKIARNRIIDRFRRDRARLAAEQAYVYAVQATLRPKPNAPEHLLRLLLDDSTFRSERPLILAWLRGASRPELADLLGLSRLPTAERTKILRNKLECLRLRLKRRADHLKRVHTP